MALLGVTGLSSTLVPAGAGLAFEVAALAAISVGPAFTIGAALATASAGAVPLAGNGGLRGSDEQLMVFRE
jgi:hypothetical protein